MTLTKRMVLALGLTALCCTKINAAPSSSQLVARYHFTGTTTLLANTNATTLKRMWNLPETAPLRQEALDKISAAPAQLLAKVLHTQTTATNWIRPLLDDVVSNESAVEVRENGNHQLSFAIAVQVDDARAAVWSGNLSNVVVTWTGAKAGDIKKGGTSGWQFKNAAALQRAGKWVVFTAGADLASLELGHQLAGPSKLKAFVGTDWFEGEVDWPHLAAVYPFFSDFNLSHVTVSLSSKEGNVYTKVEAALPQKINFKMEPWHVPALVTDPLVSFTTVRSLDSIVKPGPRFQKIGYNPFAHQLYFWAQSHLPMQTCGAVRVDDATGVLKSLSSSLPAALNPELQKSNSGKLVVATNGVGFRLEGIPLLMPYLQAHHDAAGQFVLGGLFPRGPGKMPPPKELLKQIQAQDNLIYYDWEITENRAGHWAVILQSLPILDPSNAGLTKPAAIFARNVKLAGRKWVKPAGSLLGNSITEVTVESPTQLQLRRKSSCGFTGMELVLLAHNVDATGFPLFGYQLPSSNSGAGK